MRSGIESTQGSLRNSGLSSRASRDFNSDLAFLKLLAVFRCPLWKIVVELLSYLLQNYSLSEQIKAPRSIE
jgi:hypothetical protein